MTELVLASGSQTRAEMLQKAGVPFSTIKPMVDEKLIRDSLVAEGAPPRDIADTLADMKARSVSMMKPEALVLGADQILEKEGRVFEKASTKEEAVETLQALSGGTHTLLSAAVIYQNNQPIWRFVDSAKLSVRPLSDAFIEDYLNILGDDAFWSVGCYQLEGTGAQLFTRVEGSHFTVLGMPLLPLLDFLRRMEIVPV